MSKFSRSVAEDLRTNHRLSTLFGSLNLETDEGVAAAASIGSAVLGRLVGACDDSHSATPLADAFLLVPYDTIPEALDDFENLQSSGNDLLDGLFREKRGSAAIEVASEAGVATSAVGRLFPFVAPVIVAGLRAHGRRMGLSAEGLLSWLHTDEEVPTDQEVRTGQEVTERFSLETQPVEDRQLDPDLPVEPTDTDQSLAMSDSLAELLSFQTEDAASDVAPSLLADTDPVPDSGPDEGPGLDLPRPESDFDFFGRAADDLPLAAPLGEPTEVEPLPATDPIEPARIPPPPFDQTFEDPNRLSASDPLADLRTESKGEMVVREPDPEDHPVPAVDPAMVVPEYRDIDYLREHGEQEAASTAQSSRGVSGLAWLWWIAGSVAVILLIALLLALAGSS